jgi:hypothetical protein
MGNSSKENDTLKLFGTWVAQDVTKLKRTYGVGQG